MIAVLAIVGIIALIVLIPLAFIWSVNTLFRQGIEYTFWTWLAAGVLMWLIMGSIWFKRSKD